MKKIDVAAFEPGHDEVWRFYRDIVRELVVSGQARTYDQAASRALDLMQAISADHRVYLGGAGDQGHPAKGFEAITQRIMSTSDSDTLKTAGEIEDDVFER